MQSVVYQDRRSLPRATRSRRVNELGRWIVAMHRQYYLPELVPALWIVVFGSSVLQVLLVAFAR